VVKEINLITTRNPELIPFEFTRFDGKYSLAADKNKLIIEVDNENLENLMALLNKKMADKENPLRANIIKKELGEELSNVIIKVEYEDIYENPMEVVSINPSAKKRLLEFNKEK
jgi:hypothetical protein